MLCRIGLSSSKKARVSSVIFKSLFCTSLLAFIKKKSDARCNPFNSVKAAVTLRTECNGISSKTDLVSCVEKKIANKNTNQVTKKLNDHPLSRSLTNNTLIFVGDHRSVFELF